MLRALDPGGTERNLDAILGDLKRRQLRTLFVGARCTQPRSGLCKAASDLSALAKRCGAAFTFPDGVATVPGMVQPDGMYPTFKGVQTIVVKITPTVKSALGRYGSPIKRLGEFGVDLLAATHLTTALARSRPGNQPDPRTDFESPAARP